MGLTLGWDVGCTLVSFTITVTGETGCSYREPRVLVLCSHIASSSDVWVGPPSQHTGCVCDSRVNNVKLRHKAYHGEIMS